MCISYQYDVNMQEMNALKMSMLPYRNVRDKQKQDKGSAIIRIEISLQQEQGAHDKQFKI